MLQESSVLIVGDSHVRRMRAFRRHLDGHLRLVSVEWLFRGGATVAFAEDNTQQARGHKIVVLMIGGNDLDNGMSPHQLADRVGYLAFRYIRCAHVDAVAVTSIWPRRDRTFNARAREYAEIMESRFHGDPQVTFWLWDRRQPMRSEDGVHFTRHGYEVAMTYLMAIIVWVIHHNQW